MIITEKSCKVQKNVWPWCFLFSFLQRYTVQMSADKSIKCCAQFLGSVTWGNHSWITGVMLHRLFPGDEPMISPRFVDGQGFLMLYRVYKKSFLHVIVLNIFWSIKMFWCKPKSLWNFERSRHIDAIKECSTCDVLPGVLPGDRIFEATNITSSLEDQDGKFTPLPTRLSRWHIGEIPEGWRCMQSRKGVVIEMCMVCPERYIWIQEWRSLDKKKWFQMFSVQWNAWHRQVG